MPKPRKSTMDTFVDEFCDFDIESQEKALDLMQFEHRRAKIRARKDKPEAPAVQGTLTEATA